MSTPPDVWTSGTNEKNPDAGLPNVTDLASRMWAEIQKDFGGFLLAGLIPAIGAQFAGFALVFVIYGGMFLGAVPGLVLEDELIALVGSMVGLFGGTFGSIGVLILVMAPMQASMYRAVWKYLETGEKLTIMTPFSTYTQDVTKVLLFQIVTFALSFAGMMMCYVPALVVGAALMFAAPAVYVHRLGILDAVRLSVGHLMRHPGWHLGFFGIAFLMSIVASFVPVIGMMLLMSAYPMFVLLAYRQVFGTGEAPRDQALEVAVV